MEWHLAHRFFGQLCQWHDKWRPRDIHKDQWERVFQRIGESEAQHALDSYYKTREAKFEVPSLNKFYEIVRNITGGTLAERKALQLAEFHMLCVDTDQRGKGCLGIMISYTYHEDERNSIDWDQALSKSRYELHGRYGGEWVLYHDLNKARIRMREIMEAYGWPPIPGTKERRHDDTEGNKLDDVRNTQSVGAAVKQAAKGVGVTPAEEAGFELEVESKAKDHDPNAGMQDDEIPF